MSEAGRDPSRVRAPLAELVLVRHGESVGNLAAAEAGEKGLARLDLDYRDPDTPLSDNGVEQARALGRHLAERPCEERPEVVLGSPYVRASSTMGARPGRLGGRPTAGARRAVARARPGAVRRDDRSGDQGHPLGDDAL